MRNSIALSFFIFLLYLCGRAHSKMPKELFETLLKIDGLRSEMDTYGAGVCDQETETELLILMYSLPENVANRHTVRSTWAKQGNYSSSEVRVVFLVRTPDESDVTDSLIREQYNHQDIVRTSVPANDKLMPRVMSSLVWLRNQCQKVKFVMKIRENVRVDLTSILNFVRANKDATKVVWGNVIEKTIYSTKNLQQVEKLEVTVCENWAILMTSDVIQYLLGININRDDFYNAGLKYENEYITASHPNTTFEKRHDIRFKPDSQDNMDNFVYITSGSF